MLRAPRHAFAPVQHRPGETLVILVRNRIVVRLDRMRPFIGTRLASGSRPHSVSLVNRSIDTALAGTRQLERVLGPLRPSQRAGAGTRAQFCVVCCSAFVIVMIGRENPEKLPLRLLFPVGVGLAMLVTVSIPQLFGFLTILPSLIGWTAQLVRIRTMGRPVGLSFAGLSYFALSVGMARVCSGASGRCTHHLGHPFDSRRGPHGRWLCARSARRFV